MMATAGGYCRVERLEERMRMGPDQERLTVGDVGEFVSTPKGLGRLRSLEGDHVGVRFFTAPGRDPYVDEVFERGAVKRSRLRPHTRVFRREGVRWQIGRIDAYHGEGDNRYVIALPNAEGKLLPSNAFEVRWSEPVGNPFRVLASVAGDSPQVYESRLGFLHGYAAQRSASVGVEGLVLGSVHLRPHQFRAVRRVAGDPVRRYLLADEVGLGKTIEAGALIWQYLGVNPEGRVLVLAPDHLRMQWAGELSGRFRIGGRKAWVKVLAHEEPASWPKDHIDMLIVDEAHHVTRTGRLSQADRETVASLARQADSVLLLSATPVRSNEAGFLDLLHLLDPDQYGPNDLDEFVRRVELREQLALTCQALVEDIDAFDLSLYADQLRAMFPDDKALNERLDAATAANDTTRPPLVRRLRAHLSETYRLHHRLIRTRRDPRSPQTLSVRGRGRGRPFTIEVDDESDRLRAELLDAVRAHLAAELEVGALAEADVVACLRDIGARSSSLSGALVALVSAEPTNPVTRRVFADLDDDTRRLWTRLIESIHAHGNSVLADLGASVSRLTLQKASGPANVVIASAFTETAQAIASEIERRWGTHRVARHLDHFDRDTNADEVRRWESDSRCSILVCDAGAEEGVNLQSADLLIHADLPWDTFRTEQRIGRCDRHISGPSEPIPSAVVTLGDQPYSAAWFELVADGCHVFTRSVSSLQYVLADAESAVLLELLSAGPAALTERVEDLAASLADEHVRIVAHDALDSVDASDDASSEVLASADSDRGFGASLNAWLTGVGAGVRSPAPGVIRISPQPRPQVPFDLELRMAAYFDSPLAVSRGIAVEQALPILRTGHPLVEAIAAHLRGSDRGIAFAMLRPTPGQWPPIVVMRADFTVSVGLSNRSSKSARELGLLGWVEQVLGEVAAPRTETVYFTTDGREVTESSVLRPYDKQRGDRNLASRPEVFDQLTNRSTWDETCNAALEQAHSVIQTRQTVAGFATEASAALSARVGQQLDRERARTAAGLRTDGLPWDRLADGLSEGLTLDLEVLGCGAIFLADLSKAKP